MPFTRPATRPVTAIPRRFSKEATRALAKLNKYAADDDDVKIICETLSTLTKDDCCSCSCLPFWNKKKTTTSNVVTTMKDVPAKAVHEMKVRN